MMTDVEKMIQAERDPQVLKAKLNLETARVPWSELQRFFASGSVIVVSEAFDLTEVALQVALDNRAQIEQWMAAGAVSQASDQQALEWFESNATLWTCVVKPWILVQQKNDS